MSHFSVLLSIGPDLDIDAAVETQLEAYCENTEDPQYLEFFNVEDEERESYKNDKCDSVQMPNGVVKTVYSYAFSRKYTVKDQLVYQRSVGPTKQDKRTKRAKRLKFLPDYPMRKIYKTFERYLEEYHGYEYSEEQKAYGYTCNPSATFDWYEIGGRWPYQFLVKSETGSTVCSDLGWFNRDTHPRQAPEGYQWVAGAKKADIEWELMKRLAIAAESQWFFSIEKCFETGKKPDGIACITETGIIGWNDQLLYSKGESLEQYLRRHGLSSDHKYQTDFYAFVQEGEWYSSGDMGWFGLSSNDKDPVTWFQMIQDFIESTPDSYVLVSIDCHI